MFPFTTDTVVLQFHFSSCAVKRCFLSPGLWSHCSWWLRDGFCWGVCRCLSPKMCDEHMDGEKKGLVHTLVLECRLLSAVRAPPCRSARYSAYGCGERTGSFCVRNAGCICLWICASTLCYCQTPIFRMSI